MSVEDDYYGRRLETQAGAFIDVSWALGEESPTILLRLTVGSCILGR